MREPVDRVADETGFPGVVHVSRRGRLLHERAYGLADRAHGIANAVGTQFGVASGSEGFAALAVTSLVAEGALTLDTSVRGVLGDALNTSDGAWPLVRLLDGMLPGLASA